MEFLELKDISERYMELLNPCSTEKILKVGHVCGLAAGRRVIDFGCGFGEELALWGEAFGIHGIGIDVRPYACERARRKMAERGLSDTIEIDCSDASTFRFEQHSYDLAACIGATFIFGGFQPTIRALREAIHPSGRLAIGEVYWLSDQVPPEFAQGQREVLPEFTLLQQARQTGFELEYVLRASHDDWDRYESDNWYGLLRWIEANPDHPERQEVIDHLRSSQDEYLRYSRAYFGWAIYVLKPAVSQTAG